MWSLLCSRRQALTGQYVLMNVQTAASLGRKGHRVTTMMTLTFLIIKTHIRPSVVGLPFSECDGSEQFASATG